MKIDGGGKAAESTKEELGSEGESANSDINGDLHVLKDHKKSRDAPGELAKAVQLRDLNSFAREGAKNVDASGAAHDGETPLSPPNEAVDERPRSWRTNVTESRVESHRDESISGAAEKSEVMPQDSLVSPCSAVCPDISSESGCSKSVQNIEGGKQERNCEKEVALSESELNSTRQFLLDLGLEDIAQEMLPKSLEQPEEGNTLSREAEEDAEMADVTELSEDHISESANLSESLTAGKDKPSSSPSENQQHGSREMEEGSVQGPYENVGDDDLNEESKHRKRTYADIAADRVIAANESVGDSAMDSELPRVRWPTREDLKKLLDLYGLGGYWPGKLTLERVKEHTLCPPPPGSDASYVILRFLYKLMHNCVDARNELLSENLDPAFNSADVLLCVLLVGDDFLRQEIFAKMAMLQYALPLCCKSPIQSEPILLNWSLRSVIKRWKTGSKAFIEDDLHSGRFSYCSFLRIGELPYSKSKILNKLFPKGNDPFVNSEDDDIPRLLSDGTIESSWLLPVREEVFEPVAVANLRGDAAEHTDLLQFLVSQSNTIFVFLGADLAITTNVLDVLSEVKERVVFVVSKKGISRNTAPKQLLNEGFKLIEETEAKLPSKIRNVLLTNVQKTVSFEAWEKTARSLGFALEDDKECIRKGKKSAEAVLQSSATDNRMLKLPLQLKEWKEYAQAHKEQLRMKKKPEKTSVSDYCKRLGDQKKSLRSSQSRKVPPQPFVIFTQCLVSRPAERRFFLWWLGYFLDKKSRNSDKDVVGLEHFLRELAQLYEVHLEASWETKRTSALTRILEHHVRIDPLLSVRGTVADMLLEGHPIELLDGDAQGILQTWIKDLMVELSSKMTKGKRIGVVSVLGVQSSGKSTLLNAMFGCKFTVSSGRCTRGVNMQLIKVGKYKEECDIDYVLVLDSEGLKSPEKQDLAGSTEHDSELGTLVVGLSDVVVINVASESMDALKDIIQITIHAFIRMKHTNRQKTKCLFVHQNTGDPSNFEKLKNERMIFEKTLQELTDIAIRMEFPGQKIEKDFRTILDYGKEDSHEYFPGLFSGTPPMAPINPGYSEKVMSVKSVIMKSLKNGMKLTPEQFSQRVTDVWHAVLKEDFIFSFKNSLIASKRTDLDEKIAECEWEFRQEMKEYFESMQTQILNEKTLPAVAKYARRIHTRHSEKLVELLNVVEGYVKQDPIASQYFLEEVRASTKSFVSRAEADMLQTLNNFIKNEEMKRKVDEKQVELDHVIQAKITSLVEQFKQEGKELTDEEACQEFEKLWAEQLDELKCYEFRDLKELDIDAEVQCMLFNFLRQKDHMFVKNLMLNSSRLSDYADSDIEVSGRDYQYHQSLKETAYGLANKAASFFSTSSSPLIHPNHLDPVKAFVRGTVKKYEEWIALKLSSPDLSAEGIPYISQELFKQVMEALRKYPSKGLSLGSELRLKVLVRVAAYYVIALESFRTKYLDEQDPVRKLERQKDHFRKLFLSLCASRSIAFAAAGKFVEDCLFPGLLNTVRISMDRIMAAQFKEEHEDLRNRRTCEISMFNFLKAQSNFHLYMDVIHQYKDTITAWLRRRMDQYYTRACSCGLCAPYGRSIFLHLLCERWEASVELVRNSIKTIVEEEEDAELSFLAMLKMISTSTSNKLVLRTDILEPFADSTDPFEFANSVLSLLDDPSSWTMSTTEVYADMAERAIGFLVESLIGCGQSCPFCGAPCGRNSSQHAEHTAEFHRPQVIGGYCYEGSEDAMIETCPAYIASGKSFKNQQTRWRFVSYRDYKTIYPNWNIPPDTSIESGMFWKWALVARASEFALYYGFNIESLPQAWNDITWEMVSQELTAQLQGTQNDDGDEN